MTGHVFVHCHASLRTLIMFRKSWCALIGWQANNFWVVAGVEVLRQALAAAEALA